jgi:hypothetical protein
MLGYVVWFCRTHMMIVAMLQLVKRHSHPQLAWGVARRGTEIERWQVLMPGHDLQQAESGAGTETEEGRAMWERHAHPPLLQTLHKARKDLETPGGIPYHAQ